MLGELVETMLNFGQVFATQQPYGVITDVGSMWSVCHAGELCWLLRDSYVKICCSLVIHSGLLTMAQLYMFVGDVLFVTSSKAAILKMCLVV